MYSFEKINVLKIASYFVVVPDFYTSYLMQIVRICSSFFFKEIFVNES